MRIERLDLTRYGRFTDQTLNFGQPRPGKPDLHIVLGPNEAGKTTTLNAWLDLLYGMGVTNQFAFLHEYKLMRVGARLALGDGVRDYVRIKGNKNSLLDANGNAVAEDALIQAMSGLSRAAYANMFSLDSKALEDGGREALESKGQLGEMLFSASAGLGALSGKLALLRERADGFWKPRSRKSGLAQLKSELQELRDRRKAIDTNETTYARLNNELQASIQSYQDVSKACGAVANRREALRNLLSALASATPLEGLRAKLAAIPDVPAAPADWTKRAADIATADLEARTRQDTLQQQEEQLTRKLADLVDDDAARTLEPELTALGDLHAQFITAAKSLPNRRHDLELSESQLRDMLRQLDRRADDDADALLLPAHLIQNLRDLIDRKAVIDTRLQDARREHAEAQAEYDQLLQATSQDGRDEAAAQPDEAQPDEAHVARLAALADAARQEGFPRRIAEAQRAAGTAAALLEQRLQLLAPWTGDAAALALVVAPAPSLLDAVQRELTAALGARDGLSQSIATQEAKLQQLAAELAELTRVTGAVNESGAGQARAQREQAWAAHRSALTADSADTFEAAMRHDDLVAEMRLTRQKELVEAAQLQRDRTRGRNDLEALRARIQQATDALAALRQQTRSIAAAIAPALADIDAPDALTAWLARREQALAARAPLLDTQAQLAGLLAARDEAVRELQRLLGNAHTPLPDQQSGLIGLIERADTLRISMGARRDQQAARARATSNRDARKRALQREEAEITAWREEWSAANAPCWLGADGAPPTTRVRTALDLLGKLETILKQRKDFALRIKQMERDQRQFAAALDRLAQHASTPAVAGQPLGVEPLAVFQRLQERAVAARDAARSRAELQTQLAKTQDSLRDIAQRRASLGQAVQEMAGHFRVETLQEVQGALRASEDRQGLLAQIQQLEHQILLQTGAASIEDADRQMADTDRNALTAEAASLDAELQATQMQLQVLFAEQSAAETALAAIGSDASVAHIDTQRQTIMLDIEEKTRAWLKLRFGITATELAVAAWRDSHRSTLLRHASDAFSSMSCGAWAGLEAQPGAAGDMLVAIGHDRNPKDVDKLSKGARFQLYLALRIAAYQDFTDARTPPPFVADDIMETFDDARAGATFELLANMAGKGQVIYLTHHKHLCDIAQARCPDVLIHTLSA